MSVVTQNKVLADYPGFRQSVSGLRVVAMGVAVPPNVVPNEALAELGCDSDWIVQRTGILSRHHAEPGQATSDLALQAARACLDNAGVNPAELDLIIVSTMTPDHYTPSVSCLVQAGLGCHQAATIDMNTACSGFVYGMVTAGQFLKTGNSRKALVVGAETMTMVIDPEDKKTFPLFGDAAAAALLDMDPTATPQNGSGLLSYRLGAAGELANCLLIPGGGSRMPCSQEVVDERAQYLKMDGRTVFKWAVRLVPEITRTVVQEAGLELDEIDWFVFHQANKRIIDAAANELEAAPERVVSNLERFGNTSAASIPILLHEMQTDGKLKRGDRIVIAGFGAGLTWAAGVMRW